MPRKSLKTVRVRGITKVTPAIDFLEFAKKLSVEEQKRAFFQRSAGTVQPGSPAEPLWSLAEQDGLLTGTVSFGSTRLKERALEAHGSQWGLDDEFDGLTVLHADEDAEVDICAVHGLGGNAFDTWTANTKMWLRDFLPNSTAFQKSRIMTFGYDSALTNRKNNSRIQDWADELLFEVGFVRKLEKERKRPIIFVCHSMGGIVAREAMIRLHQPSEDYMGLDLNFCGLLFLATPHSGTTVADWNIFLVDALEIAAGVRSDAIVKHLQSFNPASVESQNAFAKVRKSNQRKFPVIKCLCESVKTRVGLRHVMIVTKGSAGLDGEIAEPVMKANHREVCKFENVFEGYKKVLARLTEIKDALMRVDIGAITTLQNIPGRPRITAPHFPRDNDNFFYVGEELRSESSFIGREPEMKKLTEILSSVDQRASICIGLVGTGGIGKTEILLELALRFRKHRNIFFVRANDSRSLQLAFVRCARSIGHDILESKFPNRDVFPIWQSYGDADKAEAFKVWLREAEERHNMLIVDDLDAIQDRDGIRDALPREVPIAIFSTRDPGLCRALSHTGCFIDIPEMEPHDIVSVMKSVLSEYELERYDTEIDSDNLEEIAKVVHGHPLAACRAISYITDILPLEIPSDAPELKFIEMFNGSNHSARKRFLEYKPPIGPSVMETFEISLQRLRRHQDQADKLLHVAAYMGNSDAIMELREFLSLKRPWLGRIKEDLPDFDVFDQEFSGRGEYLAELQNVSIIQRSVRNEPLYIHPLWVECLKQRVGHEGRLRWMRQLYLLCSNPWVGDELAKIDTYRQHWSTIVSNFDIDISELK